MPHDIILFPDDDAFGDWPDDFLGDDAGEDVLDDLKAIREAVGSPLQPLLTDMDIINQRGLAATVRGIRFATGAEALLWLFHRGIFLFSNIVRFSDGTWGVSIRNSDPVEQGDKDDEGIVF